MRDTWNMFETDMYTHKAICEVLWQIYRRNEKGGKSEVGGGGGGGGGGGTVRSTDDRKGGTCGEFLTLNWTDWHGCLLNC